MHADSLQELQRATAPLTAQVQVLNDTVAPAGTTVAQQITDEVDEGLDLLSGVTKYRTMATTRTAMRNENLRLALISYQQVQDALQQQLQSQTALLAALVAGNDLQSTQIQSLSTRLATATARLDLVQAAAAALRTDLDRNTAADALVLADLAALKTRTAALEADDVLLKANDAALKAKNDSEDAAIAALQARATADEALIAAADAKAAAARSAADAAKSAADTAQATANTASSKADADAVLAQQAQAAATAAQTAANTANTTLATVQADVAKKLSADAIRRFTVATPALTIAAATPAQVAVALPTAFADANYLVFFTKASGSALLNVQLSDTNKTATGFTMTVQQTGVASLSILASSAEVFAIHL